MMKVIKKSAAVVVLTMTIVIALVVIIAASPFPRRVKKMARQAIKPLLFEPMNWAAGSLGMETPKERAEKKANEWEAELRRQMDVAELFPKT